MARHCNTQDKGQVPCPKDATHVWGQVYFCCEHFDQFIQWLYIKRVKPLRDMDVFDAGPGKAEGERCRADHPWSREIAEGHNTEFEKDQGRRTRDDKDKK